MPATAHPGAGCDKCAQHRGSGGDGWSSSFSLLEKRVWCQGLSVSHPAKGPPESLTVSWWERQSEVCCGEPAGLSRALAGCILSMVDVQGDALPAGSGSLAQVAPGVKHSSVLLALGLLRKGVRELALRSQPFILPLGSQTYLLSLSHVIGSGPDGSCLQFSMFPHLRLHSAAIMTPGSKRALILPFIPQTQ